jgi:acetyl esterase
LPADSRARRVLVHAAMGAARASLWVSPRPVALALRGQFARNGRAWGGALLQRAPVGVSAVIDEPYGDHPDEVLDVYRPGSIDPGESRPTVVWTHGGAFVGGSKAEIAGYLRILANAGFTAVGLRYSLAPEARHPTPVRQVLAALNHLQGSADRLNVDSSRLLLAGDSAGAQITAQVAATITNPEAADRLGLAPTVEGSQLRGVVLCCGLYDLVAFASASPYAALVDAVGWAYTGARRFRADRRLLARLAVEPLIGEAFPPTFLTVGNADPLAPQSVVLAAALAARGVPVDTLFFPADHQPPLEHEYQFHFDRADAEVALERLLAFLNRCARLR